MSVSPTWLDQFFLPSLVQNNGTLMPIERILNFIGCTIVDDPTNGRTNITVASGGGAAKACTLEQFGAVGDGTTNDAPAMTAAIAAINAGTYNALILGAKTYQVGANAPYVIQRGGVAILGQGVGASILKATLGTSLIRIQGTQPLEHITFFNFGGTGTGLANQNMIENGYLSNDGCSDVRCEMLWGKSFDRFISHAQGLATPLTGPITINCRADSCTTGFYAAMQSVYIGCEASNCTLAANIASGNTGWYNCDFSTNTAGYHFFGTGNATHGNIVGGRTNHITNDAFNFDVQPNGFSITDHHVYDANITINGSTGNQGLISFTNCTFDVKTYTMNDCVVRFNGCAFDTSYFVAYTETSTPDVEFVNPRNLNAGRGIDLPAFVADRICQVVTPGANADVSLSPQQSRAPKVRLLTGSWTGNNNVIWSTSPAKGNIRKLVNTTPYSASVYFTSGSSTSGLVCPTLNTIEFEGDGTNAVCIQVGPNNAASAPPLGSVDPTTLALNGFWRGDGSNYVGAPWTGTASAGLSSGRNLISNSADLTLGTAVNGFVPGASDGTKFLKINNAVTATLDYISLAAYRVILLFKPTSLNAPGVNPYNNDGIFGEDQGNWGVTADSTNGVQLYHLTGGVYKTIAKALTVGSWNLIDISYDGVNLNLSVNAVAATPVAAGNLTSPGPSSILRLGRAFATNGAVGQFLETWAAPTTVATASTAAVKSYINARYALSL